MSPTTEKSHVSDISYKAYMSKTVICCTHVISTIIILLYSCICAWSPRVCVCVYVKECLRTQDSLQYSYVHKESSLVWPDPFMRLWLAV